MKHLFTLLLLVLTISIQAQTNQNQVVFSKVTATWCPNCGTWGWDFMEGAKDDFTSNEDALVLGVHYSGNLKSDVGVWWSSNLNSIGQPTFYLNNDRVQANSGSWSNALSTMETDIENVLSNASSISHFQFYNAFINADGNIETNFIKGQDEIVNDEYFAIYIFENNVEDVQSGQSGMVMHPNVLRGVMGDNFEGELAGTPGSTPVAMPIQSTYSAPVDPSWNVDNLGLLAVTWEKIGDDFVIKHATSVENIGLLSDTENTLDESLFTVIQNETAIQISADSDEDYIYTISDISGKRMNTGTLNREVTIATQEYVSGMYLINIQKENKYFTQKIFVK